jgi:hypothetical protein
VRTNSATARRSARPGASDSSDRRPRGPRRPATHRRTAAAPSARSSVAPDRQPPARPPVPAGRPVHIYRGRVYVQLRFAPTGSPEIGAIASIPAQGSPTPGVSVPQADTPRWKRVS